MLSSCLTGLTYRLKRHAEAFRNVKFPAAAKKATCLVQRKMDNSIDGRKIRKAIAKMVFATGMAFRQVENSKMKEMLALAFPGLRGTCVLSDGHPWGQGG